MSILKLRDWLLSVSEVEYPTPQTVERSAEDGLPVAIKMASNFVGPSAMGKSFFAAGAEADVGRGMTQKRMRQGWRVAVTITHTHATKRR
ncbi:hypothetical protein VC83_01268 [Pseudogymnoascus destructans]|uniref:Uncharacterized protein n=1 Tax=Pseudogymnoascus destructans TaxID=655981 RepID=A0A177AKY7_9PEZI|nr:uncharacterized protein VC83_01268 [Pseudogymnoascus destructans]OAF62728.1 hypothetical protein VC83_01268 [Pseudogymnoascus destructans]